MRTLTYFLCISLLALASNLHSSGPAPAHQQPETELKKTITAEKTIRNLVCLKEAIESSLLESEDGSWPCSDELFRKTAQLILACYKLKQELHSLRARIYIATLEDYVAALLEQPAHKLSRTAPTVRNLTTKALGEISVATKTPLTHADEQTTIATLAFEKSVRNTVLFIKNHFLPAKPIAPRQETLLEKAQRTSRRAYTYVAETVKEYPFTSGVVAAVAVIATAYWVKQKYFNKPPINPNPGSQNPGNQGSGAATGSTPPPVITPNASSTKVTTLAVAAAQQSSLTRPDGISCGYHSAINADALIKAIIAKEKELGHSLTPEEFEMLITKEMKMKWPTREHIQDDKKKAFLAEIKKKIDTLTLQTPEAQSLLAYWLTSFGFQPQPLPSKSKHNAEGLHYQISVLSNMINQGGCIDGQTVKEFIHFLHANQSKSDDMPTFDDPDEEHTVYWKVVDKGSATTTTHSGTGTVDGEYEKCMFTLQSLRKIRKLLKDNSDAPAVLKTLINGYRTSKTGWPSVPSAEYISSTADEKVSVAELSETKDFNTINELPTAIQLLNQFHAGKRLVLNWREGYHWTCCVGVPELDTTTTPPTIKSAKGFTVDSMGPSVPAGFTALLTLLATEKPLDASEMETFKTIWA